MLLGNTGGDCGCPLGECGDEPGGMYGRGEVLRLRTGEEACGRPLCKAGSMNFLDTAGEEPGGAGLIFLTGVRGLTVAEGCPLGLASPSDACSPLGRGLPSVLTLW